MRQRLTTTLTAAAAAGLTALAVTVAAPAANEPSGGKGEGKVVATQGPTPEALISCLENHGATGIPSAGEGDGRALKEWIVTHQTDESTRSALQACDVWFGDKRPGQGGAEGQVECAGPKPAQATADKKRVRGRE
jgi:hypothetical protein